MSDLEKDALKIKCEGEQLILEKADELGETVCNAVISGEQVIEKGVVNTYKKIENAVVGGYKKMEESVVGTYKKVEDGFVDKFLTHEGENIEDAKKRMKAKTETKL